MRRRQWHHAVQEAKRINRAIARGKKVSYFPPGWFPIQIKGSEITIDQDVGFISCVHFWVCWRSLKVTSKQIRRFFRERFTIEDEGRA